MDEASHFPDWVYHLNPADMTNAVYHRLDTALLHFKVIFKADLQMTVSPPCNLRGNVKLYVKASGSRAGFCQVVPLRLRVVSLFYSP